MYLLYGGKVYRLIRIAQGYEQGVKFSGVVVHFLGGGKVKISKESVFKIFIFLLICPLLVVSSIGSAAALYEATGSQTAIIRADNGDASYILTQDRSAKVLTGDGVISQPPNSISSSLLDTRGADITYAEASQTQSVVSPSTDDSSNQIYSGSPPSNAVETINTDGVESVTLSQEQPEKSEENIYQDQTASLRIISTPDPAGRVIGIIHVTQR